MVNIRFHKSIVLSGSIIIFRLVGHSRSLKGFIDEYFYMICCPVVIFASSYQPTSLYWFVVLCMIFLCILGLIQVFSDYMEVRLCVT